MSTEPQFLDWGDRTHWHHLAKPCRHCGDLTYLRDNEHRPSHKTCAETALTKETA